MVGAYVLLALHILLPFFKNRLQREKNTLVFIENNNYPSYTEGRYTQYSRIYYNTSQTVQQCVPSRAEQVTTTCWSQQHILLPARFGKWKQNPETRSQADIDRGLRQVNGIGFMGSIQSAFRVRNTRKLGSEPKMLFQLG